MKISLSNWSERIRLKSWLRTKLKKSEFSKKFIAFVLFHTIERETSCFFCPTKKCLNTSQTMKPVPINSESFQRTRFLKTSFQPIFPSYWVLLDSYLFCLDVRFVNIQFMKIKMDNMISYDLSLLNIIVCIR